MLDAMNVNPQNEHPEGAADLRDKSTSFPIRSAQGCGWNRLGPPSQTDVALTEHDLGRRPRVALPVFLFLATCLSTFFAGAMTWEPMQFLADAQMMQVRQTVLRHAGQGAAYMVCVVGILLSHEMGHYIATRIYRIPSSLPYFIPFPIAPVGTMGAVIAMRGHIANRRQIFDIGIAGPIAGLVFAIPIVGYGVAHLDLSQAARGNYSYDLPLLVRWMYAIVHPTAPPLRSVYSSQVNAPFMAGWVGLLITGLNMLPISQLDGGHVSYTLFGSGSRWIVRAFLFAAVTYMWWAKIYIWTLMLVLIFFIGVYHPRTSDDNVPLGWPRVWLGALSLLIPVVCFPPRGLSVVGL